MVSDAFRRGAREAAGVPRPEGSGVLAETTMLERALGAVVALLVFFRLTRRNLFAGVAAGEPAMILARSYPE